MHNHARAHLFTLILAESQNLLHPWALTLNNDATVATASLTNRSLERSAARWNDDGIMFQRETFATSAVEDVASARKAASLKRFPIVAWRVN